MTALTEDKQFETRQGQEIGIPVAASTKIYGGGLVAVNAGGYGVPGADTAGLILGGYSVEQVDNSSGANGDAKVRVRRKGLYRATLDTAITQANLGDKVYLVDDQTVDLAANTTNDILAGVIAEVIDTTHAWIDIEPALNQVA